MLEAIIHFTGKQIKYVLQQYSHNGMPIAGKKFENKYQIGLGKRNVICVRDLNEAEIKTVLWTAMDLKKNNSGMNILEKKVVNILIERQTVKNLIAALSAGRHLHALTNVLYQQNLLEICGNYSDLGKLLSTQGDLLVISPRLHSTLVKVSTTATVPIINMGSLYQKPIEAFSLLMTIYEKFKRLTGINVSIIGSPSATCHSLMCTLPRLGINMNLACAHSAEERVSPLFLNVCEEYSKISKSKVTNCSRVEDAIHNYDVLIELGTPHNNVHTDFFTVSAHLHDEIVKNKAPSVAAGTDRKFLNSLTQFDSPAQTPANLKPITSEFIDNLRWVYAALMLRVMEPYYKHTIPEPKF